MSFVYYLRGTQAYLLYIYYFGGYIDFLTGAEGEGVTEETPSDFHYFASTEL